MANQQLSQLQILQQRGWQAPALGLPGGYEGWNPGGTFHDPQGQLFKEDFQPHRFVGDLIQSPQAEAYADVEGTARSQGVQAARGGEAGNIESARQTAASQGLGRGAALQAESDIRQQGTMSATDMVLQAADLENSRRYQQMVQLTMALMESNKARYARYLQKKAEKAGRQAGLQSMIGNIAGGLLGGAGAVIGAGV